MSKSLRLSEKWFRRGLWLVAFIFASFLIGLGSTIVGDLPKVETHRTINDFLAPQALQLQQQIDKANNDNRTTTEALDQARLALNRANADTQAADQSFRNWLATRSVTQQSEQDPEVLVRTHALDELKAQERRAQREVERQQQKQLDLQQSIGALHVQIAPWQEARIAYTSDRRSIELRVFLYRLLLTLPLLVVAGYLFVKKRKSTYWPFVWGFIFFALVAFFVELVPYLPSYGGYVRYAVGIIVTFLVGRYAIFALNQYLERQQQTEALPDEERRKELDYDTALLRLNKGVCPGCERPVDLTNNAIDYCSHCGINLFHKCHGCTTRKSSFARYCHSCGEAETLPAT